MNLIPFIELLMQLEVARLVEAAKVKLMQPPEFAPSPGNPSAATSKNDAASVAQQKPPYAIQKPGIFGRLDLDQLYADIDKIFKTNPAANIPKFSPPEPVKQPRFNNRLELVLTTLDSYKDHCPSHKRAALDLAIAAVKAL
jgi:hypothetical protein